MFVDTGAWYASYVVSDPNHLPVKSLIDEASTRLFTTDFVLAESLNLMRARNEFDRAVLLGQDLLVGKVAELIHLSPTDLQQAFVIFSSYRDKSWSFIDCTSLVVIQRKGIRSAIALDQHFRQMPGITVVPQ